jgi:hypothetical protein
MLLLTISTGRFCRLRNKKASAAFLARHRKMQTKGWAALILRKRRVWYEEKTFIHKLNLSSSNAKKIGVQE